METTETPIDGRTARGWDALRLAAPVGLETTHGERQHCTPAHAASKQAKTVKSGQDCGARRWAVCVCVCVRQHCWCLREHTCL